MDSDSPVKDILYQELNNISEKKIQTEISKNNSPEIINEIISNCIPKIIQVSGERAENFGILAESLMHYLISISLIPSQRKVSFEGIEVDVVIPDLKILKEKPKDSLILYFPKSKNIEKITKKIGELRKILLSENIWIVLNSDLPIDFKKYMIGTENNSIKNILDDIIEFLSKRKQSKLKIIRS